MIYKNKNQVMFMFLRVITKPPADLIGLTEKIRNLNLDLEYIHESEEKVDLFYDLPKANFETDISTNKEFFDTINELIEEFKVTLVDNNIPMKYTPISIYWDEMFYVEARMPRGATYHKRDQLIIETTIKNISNKEKILENTNQYIFKVAVLDMNRNEIKTIEGAELDETYEIALKPNEEKRENFKMNIKVSIPTVLDVLVSTEYLDIEDRLTIYQLKPMKVIMK